MFFWGFLTGVTFSVIVAAAPKVFEIGKGLTEISQKCEWFNSLAFLSSATSLYLEQMLKQNVKYDLELKTFIVSYFIGGRLYQIMVKPKRGPNSFPKSPMELGYDSIVPQNVAFGREE